MNPPPTLHLISGLPGSGKTTYAEGLRADTGAGLFSLDRWLVTAYGRYSLAETGQAEHTRRVLACRELMWASARELRRRNTEATRQRWTCTDARVLPLPEASAGAEVRELCDDVAAAVRRGSSGGLDTTCPSRSAK